MGKDEKDKEPELEVAPTLPELLEQGELAYKRHVDTSLDELNNLVNSIRGVRTNLKSVIDRFSKKKLKLRMYDASIELALNDLKETLEILGNRQSHLTNVVQNGRKFQNDLKENPELLTEKLDLNFQIAILVELFGGATALHKVFKDNPRRVPDGIDKDITVQGIRGRVRAYKKSQVFISSKK